MENLQFISQCLRQVQLRTLATCEGLDQEQVVWRPAPHVNNIGFILWHVARGEDSLIARLKGDGDTLWASDGWSDRFGHPADAPDPGDRMGLRALPIPRLDVLLGYFSSAAERTLDFVCELTPDDLDSAADRLQPGRTLAESLRHLITHKNNHHGQIDYVRGLQDESWDLPPGTGAVLPPSRS